MKQRCLNPRNPDYKAYGNKGVCDRWLSFENFLADMGDRPDWATGGIDRIDNDLGYLPENCRWATVKEQLDNRRVPA